MSVPLGSLCYFKWHLANLKCLNCDLLELSAQKALKATGDQSDKAFDSWWPSAKRLACYNSRGLQVSDTDRKSWFPDAVRTWVSSKSDNFSAIQIWLTLESIQNGRRWALRTGGFHVQIHCRSQRERLGLLFSRFRLQMHNWASPCKFSVALVRPLKALQKKGNRTWLRSDWPSSGAILVERCKLAMWKCYGSVFVSILVLGSIQATIQATIQAMGVSFWVALNDIPSSRKIYDILMNDIWTRHMPIFHSPTDSV